MSYPQVPLGGVPVKISLLPTSAELSFGDSVTIVPSLTDPYSQPVDATQMFTFTSSNPGLLTVNSDGVCTAMTPSDPNLLNTGGIVQILITYPYGNRTDGEKMSATATITVLANDAISVWYAAGRQGATSLVEASNWPGSTNNQGAGKGFLNYPTSLEGE